MEQKDVNLHEIHKLPEPEFKNHFLQWVEEDGVARALQAKLRKDLIDNFNKTNLGRKIFAQYSRTNRMILSPLILALNTLVAEFLYAQNCHFSLSVFSTEVPYRNTLPDFENHQQFRFNKADLMEIFEAIAVDMSKQFRDTIIALYLNKSTTKDNESLLYLIFKHIFKKFAVNSEEKKPDPLPESDEIKTNKEKTQRKLQSSFYNTHFRYLNKYLIILSKKVKEMSNSLEQLERREIDTRSLKRRSDQTKKIESLNRSLEKISENLRVLSLSKRKNRKISVIISAVDKMAQQLEKCADNFETISRNLTDRTKFPDKKGGSEEKSYGDWIRELKNSKSGKKFTAKIETSLRQTLENEKEKLALAFDQKLLNQKAIIKLKYKQKLLQQLENHSPTDAHAEKVKNLIEKKLEELDKKHEDLLQKVTASEIRYKENEPIFNVENYAELNPDQRFKASYRRKDPNSINQNEYNLEKNETENLIPPTILIERKYTEKTIDIKPQLEEMAKTIAEQERNIEHIIFGAKLRIQELEHESNQLDRSFQDYLQRQQTDKNRLNAGISTIWDNYQYEKSILNKCYLKRPTPLKQQTWAKTGLQFSLPNNENIHPKHALTASKDSSQEERPQNNSPKFENPFRTLQTEILVKESWKTKESPNMKIDKNPSKPEFLNASTSPLRIKKTPKTSRNDKITIKVTSPEYAENKQNQSPLSSELCLKNETLDGIILSDSKSSSENRDLSLKNSLSLKVPQSTVQSRINIEGSKDKSTDTSNSMSNISTGKRASSDGDFWD